MRKLNMNQNYNVHQEKNCPLITNTLNINIKKLSIAENKETNEPKNTYWKKGTN
jgi:hypothetical protein